MQNSIRGLSMALTERLRFLALTLLMIVLLPIVARAAGGMLPPAQLQQMSSIIRFLRIKIDAEQANASPKVKFTALLEAIELFGITVPNPDRLEPTMTNSELAIYILQGTLPVKRKRITSDVGRFLNGLPGAPAQLPAKAAQKKVVKIEPLVKKRAAAVKVAKKPIKKRKVVKPPKVRIKAVKAQTVEKAKRQYSKREKRKAAATLKSLLSSAVNEASQLDGALRTIRRAE